MFRKEREYLIQINNELFRLICIKVTKNTKGEIVSYTFTNPVIPNSKYEFTVEEVFKFGTIKEPVDNTELFQMYINWLNFKRESIHQDLKYAEELRIKILNTLKDRTHVRYGTGALIEYDLNKIEILELDII